MSWILWILAGLAGLFLFGAILGILKASGILSEFIVFLFFTCGGSCVGVIFDAPLVGCIVGGVAYLIRCIYYIGWPKDTIHITGWDDGSTTKRTLSTADKGWAGIVMLVIMAVVTGIVTMCA